ncbi:bll5589; hypothetical protein [hydrothermal vent metagenome]|uniref:Uncharacterized protein n=1 Tax=hydrothermal vent metagenome TaxID=652676 RepID=A0A1W1CZI0_9ZZZZ
MFKFFYKITLLLLLLSTSTVLYQKHTYAYHTLVQIDPIPLTQKLIKKEKYAEAYEYLSYFMQFEYMYKNTKAHLLLQKISDIRSSTDYQSSKIAEGIRTGTSDEVVGQVSAIGSDFFLIGDIRDLALESTHYFKDEKVDIVLVSLSSIGLIASVTTFFSLGSTALAKSGVSMLKLAHKSKRIPLWLRSYLVKQSKKIKERKDISSLKPLFKHLDAMRHKIGLNNTLNLLSQSKDFKSLAKMTTLSQRYGKESQMLIKLSKNTIMTQNKQLKNIPISSIKLASSYGINGFTHLLKGGEKRFIKSTQNMKAYAKIAYKGEIWKIALWLMKHLSDTMLLILMAVSTILLMPWKNKKKQR